MLAAKSARTALDPSLWITRYDLPPDRRDEYLDWLYRRYLPKLLSRPRVVHAAHYASIPSKAQNPRVTRDASVPTGGDYVLIIGGQSPHTFANTADYYLQSDRYPSPAGIELTPEDRHMLSLRCGSRVSITIEVERADGPNASTRMADGTLATCIQLGSFNAADLESEDEILAWYAHWRLPAFQTTPGCVGIRKLVTVSGWAKHEVLYEFTSLESRSQYAAHLKTAFPTMVDWNERAITRLTHAPRSPLIALRQWPAVD